MIQGCRFDRTVAALCPLFEESLQAVSNNDMDEYDQRLELVACILGSQVRYEAANKALAQLEDIGLIDDDRWIDPIDEAFEGEVYDQLSQGYRFPRARARQLAGARNALASKRLGKRLGEASDPRSMRERLVDGIPGLGPKQASMFLRNIGWSYELAILDTHVLRFMAMKKLLPSSTANVSTVRSYERTERIAITYANAIGYQVGYLDWAIWVTMKAAAELGQ